MKNRDKITIGVAAVAYITIIELIRMAGREELALLLTNITSVLALSSVFYSLGIVTDHIDKLIEEDEMATGAFLRLDEDIIAALLEEDDLTDEEVAELEEILDQLRKGKK